MEKPAGQAVASAGVDIVGRHQRLVHRTALISVFTALSRLLGYGRELLSAVLFGDSSPIYDAFLTAWRVPNLFRRLMGEGAVATSLQASLTRLDGDHGEAAGRRLFWDVLGLALGILLVLCGTIIAVVLWMPERMPGTGWHWLGPEPAALRELLVRVMPYVVFICLAGLAGGALAVRGRFMGSSAGGAVMNLVAILALVIVGLAYDWSGPGPSDGPEGFERHMDMAKLFSWGLVLSGVAQLVSLVPDLTAAGFFQRTATALQHEWVSARAVLVSSAPLALGAAVYQINVMVDNLMAYYLLPEGGATTYYYATRIQQLPLALVATAATSAVFPALQALGHRRQHTEMRLLHHQTHLAIAFIALPATFALVVLARPICAVLLEHGAFSAAGTARTALGLQVLALSIVPAGAAGLLGRTYFALGDFRTPVRVAMGLLVLNLVFNTFFVLVLDMDIEGLALGTALVSWLNVAVLAPGALRRMPVEGPAPRFVPRLLRMLVAAALCAAAAWSAHRLVDPDPRSMPALMAGVAAGLAVYTAAAAALGLEEWHAIRDRTAHFVRSASAALKRRR
jgi:putative peptidoglycan lipid II flippase